MKRLSTRQLLILIFIIDIMLFIGFLMTKGLKQKDSADQRISEPNIQKICELATLECYYHNVSDWKQDAYGIFGYGEKKIWIEYDGIVRVGIDAGKIKISDPDKDDIITVTIPEVSILEKDLDESSIKEIATDTTVLFWTDEVNIEDRRKALAAAQEDMEESAKNNAMILGEAKERAKKIIERNIVSLGEAAGKNYKVKFVDASKNVDTLAEPTAEP